MCQSRLLHLLSVILFTPAEFWSLLSPMTTLTTECSVSCRHMWRLSECSLAQRTAASMC